MFRKLPSDGARQQRPVCIGAHSGRHRWVASLELRDFFERYGFLIQEWESVRTDWLTLRPSNEAATLKPTISEAKKADMPPRRARGPSRDHDGEVCFRTF